MGRRKEEGERNGDRGFDGIHGTHGSVIVLDHIRVFARTYARLESLNISVPAASQIVDLHPLYNVQRWDLYAWAFQVELDNGEKEKRFKIFKDDLGFVDGAMPKTISNPHVVIQLTAIADGDSCPTIQRLVHKFHFDCFSNSVLGVSIEQGKRFSLKQVSLDVLACVNAPSNETEAIDDVMNDDGFPDVRNPGTAVVDLDEGDAICWLNKAHYLLTNFTLDELENFLQETNDEVDLQYADDMQEHRRFLALVLQGGDSENQPIQENENDEDEENDVDNEIDIEEALESEFDESQLGPLKDKSIQGNFANTLFLCKHRSDSNTKKMGFGDRGINNVRIWLEQLRFAKCVGLFEMHEVDKEVLPLLTVEDLKEMGINTVLSEGGAVSAWSKLSTTASFGDNFFWQDCSC
ncbi:hypothetical protein NE237_002662 [Protea cynaroides]|uniref:SAM domain-containing protein n=1 Tax=Protea cynaroides TaxID=273540 RepID=A0A9Q0GMW5_9MAGN|nr:hypothetical protein NE237_002662 [Protea cynaroides]